MIAALNYNENKVRQGKAKCLEASGYLKAASEMNFYQKLEGLERYHELNERAQTKTLHVSLNFSPSEKLSDEKLIAIASEYISRIGFGEQPFLVYKHLDAGHPHVHVVSSTIRNDGSRINTHNIGRNQSEKARKEIEKNYLLIPAERQKEVARQRILPVSLEKATYGKTETKKSITNVVNAVLNTYHYCSLPEFNAVLKQFNVVADRGKEEGRIFKHRGLVYRILDKEGNKIGVPIKASSINNQPTLSKLESLFILNKEKKEVGKQELKATIDEALTHQSGNWKELVQRLGQQRIYTVLRQNAEGRIYGVTFVDNKHKTVFNGSDLGKGYSAAHLQNRFLVNEKNSTKGQLPGSGSPQGKQETIRRSFSRLTFGQKATEEKKQNDTLKTTSPMEELLSAEKQHEAIPFQLLKKKRRRKKRSLGL